MSPKSKQTNMVTRAPIVVVMGHIDHGKSRLLDYIRKTNIVEGEAGGITQHVAAYEVIHKDEKGNDRKITFLDTPGHEAFSKIRERGAELADIAILVVSAEDGVKAQTVEALKVIKESKLPYVVAINKIDKPGADVEKTKMNLIENEVYLEGMGGDVPFMPISAKEGTNVSQLLDLVLILADLGDLQGNLENPASGFVLESSLDSKRGISATLIIKEGSIQKGMFVVSEDSFCPTRILENFMGNPITEASFSSPIKIVGWNKVPTVGAKFQTYKNKKSAEEAICINLDKVKSKTKSTSIIQENIKTVPLIIKADTFGSIEAIEKETLKLGSDEIQFKIIKKDVGAIGEGDLKLAQASRGTVIIGFNVKTDQVSIPQIETENIKVKIFDVIYEISDWLKNILETNRPKKEIEEITGKIKILKLFSKTKDKQIIGGRVMEGKIKDKSSVKIMRRENEIGKGVILSIEANKVKTGEIEEGKECGMLVESKIEIAPGDILESFIIVCK